MKEALLTLNEFNTPKIIKDLDVVNTKIIRLMMYEKGTSPDQPDKGFGLRSRYRLAKEDELPTMEIDLKKQISVFLPTLQGVDVKMEIRNKILYIGIEADNALFEYSYDGEKIKPRTLRDI